MRPLLPSHHWLRCHSAYRVAHEKAPLGRRGPMGVDLMG